ncbi:class II aldolase/adducin family protein [Heliomarina baculiformis]|uniref:class II aldolase/adducin family protein n=1 Tax=Heliomarina baculiformis TaxID=2872036 RepID=UPI001EE2FC31|nr:class II aldolase/adducin family protein [Heliomarina baculiformis]
MKKDIRPDHMTEIEWKTRQDLAACYRLAALHRMTDLIYTHITARVPDEDDAFLINPYGWRWEEITASSLVKIDTDGNKLDDSPHDVNPAGFTIHSAVHRARHDASWVMHTHTRAGVAVSCLEEGLLPLNQIALQFYGRVGYHDFQGIALDLAERDSIVEDLGDNPVLILRNHGLLTVGGSAAEMYSNMFYLERSCEIQMSALSAGRKIQEIPKAVCDHTVGQYSQGSDSAGLNLEWQAHLRSIEAIDPTYRT